MMNYEQWRHSARAWLLHFIGKTDLAYEEYVTAFHLAPTASAARNLGFIAATKDRLDDAVSWFQEAVRLEPGDAETWFNLGFARERRGLLAEAVAAFREATRLKPELDRAWYGIGIACAKLGQHGEAATALEEVARYQPMHGEAWYQLGMAQHHAHNPDRVKQVIEKLRAFDPKRSNQLIHDAERSDLTHLIQQLPY